MNQTLTEQEKESLLFRGAWIEVIGTYVNGQAKSSRSSFGERGLKL